MINQEIKKQYETLGIKKEVIEFAEQVEESLQERFKEIDQVCEYNQLKVIKAMQKNTRDRYQSAAEVLYDLEELKRNPSVKFDYYNIPAEDSDRFATKVDTPVVKKPKVKTVPPATDIHKKLGNTISQDMSNLVITDTSVNSNSLPNIISTPPTGDTL